MAEVCSNHKNVSGVKEPAKEVKLTLLADFLLRLSTILTTSNSMVVLPVFCSFFLETVHHMDVYI